MSATTSMRTSSRLTWFLLACLVALLPVVLQSVWDLIEMQRLATEVKQLGREQTSAPLPPAPPEIDTPNNAGAAYSAAALLSLTPESQALQLKIDKVLATPVTGPEFARLEHSLETTREVFALIDQGAGRPFVGFPGGTEFQLRSAGATSMLNIARARTAILALAGNSAGALQSALSALAAERVFRRSSWIPPADLSIAGLLQLRRVESDDLRSLQNALADNDDTEIANFLRSRRALYLDAMLQLHFGTSLAEFERTTRSRSLPELVRRPVAVHRLVNDVKEWQSLIDVSERPFQRNRQRFQAALSASEAVNKPSIATAMFVVAARSDALAVRRATLVAVAVERYRRAHNEALPADLTTLVPDYLDAVPSDPFGDGPIRYVRSSTSYTTYSVGSDGIDDGGNLTRESSKKGTRDFGVAISIESPLKRVQMK
jgi:hypothetical protein